MEANEPHTLCYEWYVSDDGTDCYLVETYADSEPKHSVAPVSPAEKTAQDARRGHNRGSAPAWLSQRASARGAIRDGANKVRSASHRLHTLAVFVSRSIFEPSRALLGTSAKAAGEPRSGPATASVASPGGRGIQLATPPAGNERYCSMAIARGEAFTEAAARKPRQLRWSIELPKSRWKRGRPPLTIGL